MGLFSKQRLGIDLGTANTIIYIENKGIALREPTLVALSEKTGEAVAFGHEAAALLGRTSDSYKMIYPIQDGVIANFTVTKQLLAYFITKVVKRSFSKPEVVICVPSHISKVEHRAVIDALRELGITRAMIIDEPYAAALGSNLPIQEPKGRMIIDIGGGTTDVAILSYGEIVTSAMIRHGGNRMNQVIKDAIRDYHKASIGEATVEEVKQKIGVALYSPKEDNESDSMLVKGSNIASGIPTEIKITTRFVARALNEVIEEIIRTIQQVLEQTPPELAADLIDNGIVLTGGGSLLRRLPERIQSDIGLPVTLAQTPMDCVAIGAGKTLKQMSIKAKLAEKNSR